MNTLASSNQSDTRYLATAQGRLAYDIAGTGPLLVMVPGMGELRSSFRYLAPLMVAAGYTVVTADLRGHGDSDATFASYGDEATADDIVALLEELGRPAVIVGNSLAAASAVLVAARRPELVLGLALLGPFVRNPANANAFTLGLFRVLMARPWVTAVWKGYLPSLYKGARPADFNDYLAAIVAALRRPGHARAFSLTTRTSHAAAERNLPLVKAPAIILMGALDPDFPDPAAEAAWIGTALHGEVVMVADSGHYPQSQQPEVTAAALVPFLASVAHNA